MCALEKELSLEARTTAAAADFEPEHVDAADITIGSDPSAMGAMAQTRRQAMNGEVDGGKAWAREREWQW